MIKASERAEKEIVDVLNRTGFHMVESEIGY